MLKNDAEDEHGRKKSIVENARLTLRPVWPRPLTPRTSRHSHAPPPRARHDDEGARARDHGGARGG